MNRLQLVKTVFACITLLVVSVQQLQAGVIAVNWGGDYVSHAQNYHGHVPANASANDHYGDPHGPFAADIDGDGPDDSIVGRAFSQTLPFSPPNNYAGTSATFYGGQSVTRENSGANDGYTELVVLNQGPNDSIHYHVDTGGDSHTFHLLQYWDKADFLNGLNSLADITLDSGGAFTLSTSQSAGNHQDQLLRWVVREGTQFFVSEGITIMTNNAVYNVPYSSLTNWSAYSPVEPTGTPGAAHLWSLDFDETSTSSPKTFSDVTGLGFYIEHEMPTGPVNLHIEGFSATAAAASPDVVPEPTSLAVFGLGSMAMVASGLRRRKNRSAKDE